MDKSDLAEQLVLARRALVRYQLYDHLTAAIKCLDTAIDADLADVPPYVVADLLNALNESRIHLDTVVDLVTKDV